MKSLKPWEAHCLVWWLRLELAADWLSERLRRHESKVFWGGVILFILYLYFLASVTCLNDSDSCWVASSHLAATMFTFFGMK